MDKKNFVQFFSQFRADKDADMFCGQLFNAFDADRSGCVDFSEFLIAISLAKDADPKQKLRFAFKMYDTDNDDRLSLEEIEKIIEGVYNFNSQKNRDGANKPREVAKYMLKRFDKDHNGHLTEDEFIESLADPTLMALESFSVFRSGTFHLAETGGEKTSSDRSKSSRQSTNSNRKI